MSLIQSYTDITCMWVCSVSSVVLITVLYTVTSCETGETRHDAQTWSSNTEIGQHLFPRSNLKVLSAKPDINNYTILKVFC